MSQQQMEGEEMAFYWSIVQDLRPKVSPGLIEQLEQELGFGGKSKAAEKITGKETWND